MEMPYALVMELSLREVRYFVAAADAGSFTDAAALLFVSQAAVSRTIASFENAVGDRVFRRLPAGCELTSTGQQLLPHARRVLLEASRFSDFLSSRESVMRLGYAWSALGEHTTRLQRDWSASDRSVGLEIVRHNSPTAGLAEGACDVAVIRGALDDKRFESVVVGLERRLVVFASDDPQWSRRRSVRMAEIADRTVIIDPKVGTTSIALWAASDRAPQVVEALDIDGWLDAIAAGRGVGVTAEATAHHHPRAGVTYRPVSDGPRIPVRIAWRRDDPPPALTDLVDAVTALYLAA